MAFSKWRSAAASWKERLPPNLRRGAASPQRGELPCGRPIRMRKGVHDRETDGTGQAPLASHVAPKQNS
jgi:hypothetical protein